MSEYYAVVKWTRGEAESFVDDQYSRGHSWEFDGGLSVPATSSPHIVPLPYSVEGNVDPEQAFVAALSSCHMLFFLSIAAKRQYVVDDYRDNAVGVLEKDGSGKMVMTKVTLRPAATFSGDRRPSAEAIEKMHHRAHDLCFIANSVTSEVSVEIPVDAHP